MIYLIHNLVNLFLNKYTEVTHITKDIIYHNFSSLAGVDSGMGLGQVEL